MNVIENQLYRVHASYTWQEQKFIVAELAEHLATSTLFALHTARSRSASPGQDPGSRSTRRSRQQKNQ